MFHSREANPHNKSYERALHIVYKSHVLSFGELLKLDNHLKSIIEIYSHLTLNFSK